MICNVCNGIKNIKTTYGGYIMCQNCDGVGYIVSSEDNNKATEELRIDFLEDKINKQQELIDLYKNEFMKVCEEIDNMGSRIDSICNDLDSLEVHFKEIEEILDSTDRCPSNKLERISEEMKELFTDTEKDLDFVTPEEAERIQKEVSELSAKKRGRPKKSEPENVSEFLESIVKDKC